MRRSGDGAFRADDTLGGARFGPRTKRDLIQLCRDVRDHVETKQLASTAELTACWPARKNASVWDWVYCWAQLSRFSERGRRPQSETGADQVAIEVLLEKPRAVALSDGSTVEVHPKSLEALIWFEAQDKLLSWLADRENELLLAIDADSLDRAATDAPFDTLARLAEERTDTLARLVAQACSAGARLDREVEVDHYRALSPADLYRINYAFLQVNAGRLNALRAMSPHRSPGRSDATMPWSVLMATAADLWGEDPKRLISDRSFAATLGRIQLSVARGTAEETA